MRGPLIARLREFATPPVLAAFGGVLWLGALLAMVLVDANPEWEAHQKRYRDRLAAAADDAASVRHAERFKVRVKQIDLPALERVDRCISCHVGIEDPAFAGAPQPIAAHPGDLLTIHAPERFGCTICHGGDGRATSREDAHGLPEPSLYPMLRGEYLQAACGKCHGDDEFVAGSRLEVGRRLFDHYGCRTCHRLYQSGNTAGPDLTKVGSKKFDAFFWGESYKGTERSVAYWLETHFKNPSAFYPSAMLDYKMSDENARALVVYMLSLTDETIPDRLKPSRAARKP